MFKKIREATIFQGLLAGLIFGAFLILVGQLFGDTAQYRVALAMTIIYVIDLLRRRFANSDR